jgi:hypothetical protein
MFRCAMTAFFALSVSVALIVGAPLAAAQQKSSFDDTARFLAGMQPTAGSPLSELTKDSDWQRHAKLFDSAWSKLDERQLSKVRAWSTANIKDPQPVLYYMFSGPDFLYADTLFPNASTYVFSGLEPIGRVPELTEMKAGALDQDLRELQNSLNSVLNFSFFITKKMRVELATGRLTGTLPVLYVFLARAGKSITSVDYIDLASDGSISTGIDPAKAKAAKIRFKAIDGREQTLYYFSTDVSDKGLENSGFLQFCASLGTGSSFVKSASYLMHIDAFSKVRSFLIEKSANILQDDSGIPVKFFDARSWDLKTHGNYLQPLGLFPGTYQTKLRDLFKQKPNSPLDFGIGYRWRPKESNLMFATKTSASVTTEPPLTKPEVIKPKAAFDTKPRRVTKTFRAAGSTRTVARVKNKDTGGVFAGTPKAN